MAVLKQITVFLENVPGRLATLCNTLEERGVNLQAMTTSEASEASNTATRPRERATKTTDATSKSTQSSSSNSTDTADTGERQLNNLGHQIGWCEKGSGRGRRVQARWEVEDHRRRAPQDRCGLRRFDRCAHPPRGGPLVHRDIFVPGHPVG